MSERSLKAAKVFDILLAVMTVLLGILFVISTADIWFSGRSERDAAGQNAYDTAINSGMTEEEAEVEYAKAVAEIRIYTPKKIGDAVRSLYPVIGVWILLLICGAAMSKMRPKIEKKAPKTPEYMVEERLYARVGGASGSDIYAYKRRGKVYLCILVSACILLSVLPLVYLLDRGNFPAEDLTGEVLHGILYSLPLVVCMFVCGVIYIFVRDRNIKKLIAAERAVTESQPAGKNKNKRLITALRILLLCIGVGLTVLGCLNGSMGEVFEKATKICTECIGLG